MKTRAWFQIQLLTTTALICFVAIFVSLNARRIQFKTDDPIGKVGFYGYPLICVSDASIDGTQTAWYDRVIWLGVAINLVIFLVSLYFLVRFFEWLTPKLRDPWSEQQP